MKLVDGAVLDVEQADGTVVRVETDDATKVTQQASMAAVSAGDTVTISGSSATDGTVTATSIIERPAP